MSTPMAFAYTGVHGVFDVDVCAYSAGFLCLSNGGHCESGFSGGFGTVDLYDTPAGEASDSECDV